MIRKMIKIDRDKCNGCGLCITACHEGALQLVDGKAKLIADSYCDGLGACLPECPTGAMTIEEREAVAFDEAAVQKHMAKVSDPVAPNLACGCPGNSVKLINRENSGCSIPEKTVANESQLKQWPCQIKLVPVNAPYFDNARLLIAADCTAFAYANIHNDFMQNKITLIGCPKLDDVNYADKLRAIFETHEIQSVEVLRMSVPCCGGIVRMVEQALADSGKVIPSSVVTIGTDGKVMERN